VPLLLARQLCYRHTQAICHFWHTFPVFLTSFVGESQAFCAACHPLILHGLPENLMESRRLLLKICVVGTTGFHFGGISSLTLLTVVIKSLPYASTYFLFFVIGATKNFPIVAPRLSLSESPVFIVGNSPTVPQCTAPLF
jgi:hypothetical protein